MNIFYQNYNQYQPSQPNTYMMPTNYMNTYQSMQNTFTQPPVYQMNSIQQQVKTNYLLTKPNNEINQQFPFQANQRSYNGVNDLFESNEQRNNLFDDNSEQILSYSPTSFGNQLEEQCLFEHNPFEHLFEFDSSNVPPLIDFIDDINEKVIPEKIIDTQEIIETDIHSQYSKESKYSAETINNNEEIKNFKKQAKDIKVELKAPQQIKNKQIIKSSKQRIIKQKISPKSQNTKLLNLKNCIQQHKIKKIYSEKTKNNNKFFAKRFLQTIQKTAIFNEACKELNLNFNKVSDLFTQNINIEKIINLNDIKEIFLNHEIEQILQKCMEKFIVQGNEIRVTIHSRKPCEEKVLYIDTIKKFYDKFLNKFSV